MQAQLKRALEEHHVHYRTITHDPTYTATQTAQSAHVSGKQLAKAVVVKLDGRFAMVVLPAHRRVDLHAIKELSHAKKIELAKESEFNAAFPECETGALPAIGKYWGMETYFANSLTKQPKIIINAGSHTELCEMPVSEYLEWVDPILIPWC
jgi:Ala-tRNA(Pro) deacylase